jgi:hypothetical protein
MVDKKEQTNKKNRPIRKGKKGKKGAILKKGLKELIN